MKSTASIKVARAVANICHSYSYENVKIIAHALLYKITLAHGKKGQIDNTLISNIFCGRRNSEHFFIMVKAGTAALVREAAAIQTAFTITGKKIIPVVPFIYTYIYVYVRQTNSRHYKSSLLISIKFKILFKRN